MKIVQHGKKKHKKDVAYNECNMNKVQHEKSAT